jgi:hypothetical protein
MNTVANDDPMDDDYWARFETRDKQVEVNRNRRDSAYGGMDPATWGWRRPNPADLQAERIAEQERAAAETPSQQE